MPAGTSTAAASADVDLSVLVLEVVEISRDQNPGYTAISAGWCWSCDKDPDLHDSLVETEIGLCRRCFIELFDRIP